MEVVDKAELFRLIISSDLKWNARVDHVLSKASKRILTSPLYNLEELELEEMNFVLFMSRVFDP